MLISFSINFKQFFFSYFTPFFTISHLFSHPFQLFFGHCTTPCLYQPIKKKVSPYLSRFSNYACYKFVTSYTRTDARTHARTDELLDHNTSSRPKGPRAKIVCPIKLKFWQNVTTTYLIHVNLQIVKILKIWIYTNFLLTVHFCKKWLF